MNGCDDGSDGCDEWPGADRRSDNTESHAVRAAGGGVFVNTITRCEGSRLARWCDMLPYGVRPHRLYGRPLDRSVTDATLTASSQPLFDTWATVVAPGTCVTPGTNQGYPDHTYTIYKARKGGATRIHITRTS